MESQDMSMLSSLKGEAKPEDYVQPHYKESYRLAIDRLVSGGRKDYEEFLKEERVGGFLSEEELLFIAENAERPSPPPANPAAEEENGGGDGPPPPTLDDDNKSSTGTYWPMHSDVETPDLDLGWPEVVHERLQTHVDLLFHPPRQNNLTIKEVIRKHIQDARQVIAIVMDIFTDVDIFKETVDASIRGVPVYILLDDSHLKRFLTMAENLDIKIHTLRNMRVRTVKGQEYLCRSGAKFHGAMEQKFLVVDCQTVVYGSYSFMWSYEKINLSMVQVITGHLVQSYDEEFRTLYARSTVPIVLSPPEGVLQDNKMNGRPVTVVPKYVPQSGHSFERKDQLRHTLDAVYRKTCERQMSVRDVKEMLYEEEPIRNVPPSDYGMGAPNRMPRYQPPEAAHFLKRHSYAGERQEAAYAPQNTRYRASNWNVSGGDAAFSNGRNKYPGLVVDNYLQVPQTYRGRNTRYDKPILAMQQNTPTLENTSKAFLRTWRIESYLNNAEAPVGDSRDYLDQYETPDNKANYYMQARMRASFVFQSTIPEQQETNSGVNNSTPGQVDPNAVVVPNATTHYPSTQWNPTAAAVENRARNEEILLKRRSLQILDDQRNNTAGYVSGRNGHNSVYASLSRAKGGPFVKPNDIDNWNKRHSVADPRSDHRDDCEPLNPMYGGAFVRRQSGGFNVQNGVYGSNISEDQRSVSHYDVYATKEAKSPPVPSWQEPPSRTVSAAALDTNSKESGNSIGDCAPCYLKKSSRKIRSLLNIPEKKEASAQSQKLDGSTDTIRAEDEERKSVAGGTSNSVRIPSVQQRNPPVVAVGKPSAPRFSTEELHQNPPAVAAPRGTRQQHSRGDRNEMSSRVAGNWRKDGEGDSRLYSRFEPFCSLEKHSSCSATGSASVPSQEKTKNLLVPKSEHLSRGSIGSPDNKLGRFIQRVGNLIHKNK